MSIRNLSFMIALFFLCTCPDARLAQAQEADSFSYVPQLTVQVTGKCARYFEGEIQVRRLPKKQKCRIFVRSDTAAMMHERSSLDVRFDTSLIVQKISQRSGNVLSRRSFAIDKIGDRLPITLKAAEGLVQVSAFYNCPLCAIQQEPVTSCEQLQEQIQAELTQVRACTRDDECGQVLPRTSCGCTKDLVATVSADTTRLYELMDKSSANQCEGVDFISTCDCPAVSGYTCSDGMCAWQYVKGAL